MSPGKHVAHVVTRASAFLGAISFLAIVVFILGRPF